MNGTYPATRDWHGRVLCLVESESCLVPSAAGLRGGTGQSGCGPFFLNMTFRCFDIKIVSGLERPHPGQLHGKMTSG
jgi:hypothetical protein